MIVGNLIDNSQRDLRNFSLAELPDSDTVLNFKASLYRGMDVMLPTLEKQSTNQGINFEEQKRANQGKLISEKFSELENVKRGNL